MPCSAGSGVVGFDRDGEGDMCEGIDAGAPEAVSDISLLTTGPSDAGTGAGADAGAGVVEADGVAETEARCAVEVTVRSSSAAAWT